MEVIVSAGSEVEKEILPDVRGMDAFNAMQKLVNAGFKNVEREYTSSAISKDLVVEMSVEANKEYDVTTKIILYVSDGSQSAPPMPDEGKRVTVNVPTMEDVLEADIIIGEGVNTVVISLKQGDTVIYTSEAVAFGSTLTVALNGVGAQEYDLCVNDQLYSKLSVNFDSNENS